jgi:hypothetical protein
MKQPEEGDTVQFITDVDNDGWPEIREGTIVNVHVDALGVQSDGVRYDINPDHCLDLYVGKMFAGLWRYKP